MPNVDGLKNYFEQILVNKKAIEDINKWWLKKEYFKEE